MARSPSALTFNGSASDTIAVASPFWSASRYDVSGIALGESMDDQGWFDYNPIRWMHKNIVPNLIQMNVAKIGHGKTTLVDHIAAMYSAIQIGDNPEYEMRVWADNIRKLHGSIELGRLADFFDSTVVGSAGRRVNPLNQGYTLSRDQQLEFIEDAMVIANKGRPLERHLPYAISVATEWMYREHADDASFDTLGELMRVLDLDAEAGYRAHRSLSSRLGKELSPKLLEITQRSGGVNLEDFRNDAFRGYELLDRLTNQFGGRFGGLGSDAEELKQRAVVYDLSDLTDEAITLNQQFNWLVRNNANATQNRDFMFQIDIHDENWKLWNYLTYAKAMFAYLKQIRSYETLVIMNTHRPNDYQAIGGDQGELATKMLSDVGMWFVGRQEPADAFEIRQLLGLNAVEERRLTTLTKGQWGIKLGTDRMVFINTSSVYTSMLKQMSFSNQALNVLLNRSNRYDEERAFQEEAAS